MTVQRVMWDERPSDIRADPAATVANARAHWERAGAVFDNGGRTPIGEEAVATGVADGVAFGIVDYGESTSYLIVQGQHGHNLDAADRVVRALVDAGAMADDEVLEWLPAVQPRPDQEFASRIEEIEVALAQFATRVEAAGVLSGDDNVGDNVHSRIRYRAADALLRVNEAAKDQWYAVSTPSGGERHVKEILEDAAAATDPKFKIYDVVIPASDAAGSGGRRKVTDKGRPGKSVSRGPRKGLVLVNAALADDAWSSLKSHVGLEVLASETEEPHRLSRSEVDELLKRNGAKTPVFHRGDHVKVTHGPLKDLAGEVVDETGDQLQIEVELFGRTVALRVDPDELERTR